MRNQTAIMSNDAKGQGMPITRKLCCGCSLCVQICPRGAMHMTNDSEGFAYPLRDETSCVNCNLCRKNCPAQQGEPMKKRIKTFAAYSHDEGKRKISSSGGLFSALAVQVLDKGGMVCGAAFDASLKLRHICIEDHDHLLPLLNSKYLQSDISGVFEPIKQALAKKQLVLFAGTPCQVAAISQYCGGEDTPLLLVSIVCQGVPSPRIFEKYLFELSDAYQSPVTNVCFRDKTVGWYDYCMSVDFANGKRYANIFYQDPYMRLALNRVLTRPSCSSCFGKCDGNVADIIIGDFWAIQVYIRKYRNNDKLGFSLALTATEKGELALMELKKAKKIKLDKTSMRGMITYNPAIFEPIVHHSARAEFFAKADQKNLMELDSMFLPEVPVFSALPHKLTDILMKRPSK